MRWRDLRRSENVRDARGEGGGGMRTGLPIPLGRGGAGVGVDVRGIEPRRPLVPGDESSSFVAAILGSTEDVWGQVFSLSGRHYVDPELTLFDGAVESACGYATAAVGPFYCSTDHRIYLDTS